MCEVCKTEGMDSRFKNGPKNLMYKSLLYKVFKDNIASIRLCYVHSVDLFTMGEKKFLQNNLKFARSLAKKSYRMQREESSSPFGF